VDTWWRIPGRLGADFAHDLRCGVWIERRSFCRRGLDASEAFADIGCLTCKTMEAFYNVYRYEFKRFIEPSFPWQVLESGERYGMFESF
jgi:hypothetical protein